MKTPDPKENYPEYLYQAALLAGVPLRDIDDLTAEDIVRAVNARQEQLNEFAKTLAWIGYNCAALSGVAINDPQKFPSLEEAFPTLFETTMQQDWWIMKERVEKFAAKRESSS
mgnify:CR=1 FL=1